MYIFFKVLKWVISMSSLIAGFYFLKMTMDGDNIKPIGLAIPMFGIVFWLSKSTYEGPKKTFITGFSLLITACVAAYFLYQFYVRHTYPIGFFMTWEIVMLAITIPGMWYTFWKED